MKNLSELIGIYRALLNSFFEEMQVFASEDDGGAILNDWKQSNWELIVECNLYNGRNIFIQPYGEGADYYGESSRILKPEAIATHSVNCTAENMIIDRLTNNIVNFPQDGLPLECFVTMKSGWYYEEPPFDHALIYINDDEIVVSLKDITFILANEE